MTTTEDPNPNSTPPDGSSGPVSASEPRNEAQGVQVCERAAGGRTADLPLLECSRVFLNLPHDAHAWEPQPGMPAVWCCGLA